jgi:hypothetical protein
MTIEVIELEEQQDGSARLVLDIDNETARLLIESAVVAALTGYVDKHESNSNPYQTELDL